MNDLRISGEKGTGLMGMGANGDYIINIRIFKFIDVLRLLRGNGVVKTIPKITQTSITDTCVARSVPIFFPVSLCFLVWI